MKTLESWLFAVLLVGAASCGGDEDFQRSTQSKLPEVEQCFSPTQNLDIAYEEGSAGCVCRDGDEEHCLPDSTGREVALVCEGGRWIAVEDGPCMPSVDRE